MKKLTKHKVIFLTFFMFICAESIAADQILPPPKPTIDKETKITITKKKNIYPAKKPNLKKKNIETNVDKESSHHTNTHLNSCSHYRSTNNNQYAHDINCLILSNRDIIDNQLLVDQSTQGITNSCTGDGCSKL